MSIDFLTTKHPLLAGLNLTNPIQAQSQRCNLSNNTKPPGTKVGPGTPSDPQKADDFLVNARTVLLNGIPYTMTDRKEETMEKVRKFYEEFSNLERMLDVVEGRSKISLRLLDWLVTNYAKKYDIIYGIQKGDDLRQFMVYPNYRAQLKAYQKELFDPFCRHERIKFQYGDDGKVLRTTVGQLNFFRWAIENLVLDYAESHYEEITADMKSRARTGKTVSKTVSGSKTGPKTESKTQSKTGPKANAQIISSPPGPVLEPIVPLAPKPSVPAVPALPVQNVPIKIVPRQKNKKKELSISATKTISTHEVKILVKFD